jgi:hypothetical protein
MFLVRNKDGTHTAMVLEFKTHLTGSMSWSTAIRSSPIVVDVVPRLDVRRSWYARLSPQKLTKLAVFIAGRERAAVASEWRSHLSGEGGSGLPADRQVREAAGFVLAAIQYRVQDIVDLAWKPADAVLASRKLSNMVVFFATLIIALIYVHQGGPYELADNVGGVGVTWGAAFGLIHVGRQWRGVKPPQRKPRRTNQ